MTIGRLSRIGTVVAIITVLSLGLALLVVVLGQSPIAAVVVGAPGLFLAVRVVWPAVRRRFDDDIWIDTLLQAHANAVAMGDARTVGACHRKIVMTTDARPDRDWSSIHLAIGHAPAGCLTCADYAWVTADTL